MSLEGFYMVCTIPFNPPIPRKSISNVIWGPMWTPAVSEGWQLQWMRQCKKMRDDQSEEHHTTLFLYLLWIAYTTKSQWIGTRCPRLQSLVVAQKFVKACGYAAVPRKHMHDNALKINPFVAHAKMNIEYGGGAGRKKSIFYSRSRTHTNEVFLLMPVKYRSYLSTSSIDIT